MLRNHLILLAGFLAFSASTAMADDTNLVLRMFPIPAGSFHSDRPIVYTNAPFPDGSTQQGMGDVKEFYRKCGVSFPPGASITYNPHASLLYHYNTEENQKLFGRIIDRIVGVPFHVQLDALFVDFPRKDIERLARANPAPSSQELLDLWKSGKGTLLHALKLITQSGANAQIQAVSEHIYATEFNRPSSSNAADQAAAPLPVPDVFDTRESGATFNVTPTVESGNRTITVVLAPELTAKPEWHTLSVTGTDATGKEIHLAVPQPTFHSRNITTSIVVQDGSTTVLGGMDNPQGDGVTYLFLTVTLLDSAGRPLADYAGETPRE